MAGQTQSGNGGASWRRQYRPYIVAVTLAFVMTMLIAPEVNEGDAMSPTIKDGQVVIITKTSYSAKRGVPEKGQLVILEKTAAVNLTKDNLIARVTGLPGEKAAVDGTEVTLGKNEVFLQCDNNDEKMDSRNKKLGPVDMKLIKGNVKFIIWPLSSIGGVH